MSTFDIIVILSAFCGVLMVVGGIILLYKGIIKLSGTSQNEALSLEFKKEFRVSTQYPALGIFLIGLIFVVVAMIISKPQIPSPIEFRGTLENIKRDASLSVEASHWNLRAASDGKINGKITPCLDILWVEVTAPGYEPAIKSIRKDEIQNGIANLGNLNLKQIVSKVESLEKNIKKLPTGYNVPPLTDSGSFGGVK